MSPIKAWGGGAGEMGKKGKREEGEGRFSGTLHLSHPALFNSLVAQSTPDNSNLQRKLAKV